MDDKKELENYIKELGEKMGELFAKGFIEGAINKIEDSKKED